MEYDRYFRENGFVNSKWKMRAYVCTTFARNFLSINLFFGIMSLHLDSKILNADFFDWSSYKLLNSNRFIHCGLVRKCFLGNYSVEFGLTTAPSIAPDVKGPWAVFCFVIIVCKCILSMYIIFSRISYAGFYKISKQIRAGRSPKYTIWGLCRHHCNWNLRPTFKWVSLYLKLKEIREIDVCCRYLQ